MKFLGLTIAAFVSLSSAAWAAPAGGQPTAVGLWEQVDEKTGKAESWFNIVEKDGVYVGTIVKMFQKPGDPPPSCCAARNVRVQKRMRRCSVWR